MSNKNILVLDIGGTNFRIGLFSPNSHSLSNVKRFPTPNFIEYPKNSVSEIQKLLVDTIVTNINTYIEEYKDNIECIGISFAGPIDKQGGVRGAPTIWGKEGDILQLGEIISERVKKETGVINDITAAAWKYSDDYDKPFCVITVSSGIGNKVFYKNEVLINDEGFGGEIGHYRCELNDDSIICDCGGIGHLGAISSGRGVLELAKRTGRQQPELYKQSLLNTLSNGNIDSLTNKEVVYAIHKNDEFAIKILKKSHYYLADAMSCIYNAIGVDNFIIIGGFAIAVGKQYIDFLTEQLKIIGCFGKKENDIEKMIRLGESNDDHCLIGAGIYMLKRKVNG